MKSREQSVKKKFRIKPVREWGRSLADAANSLMVDYDYRIIITVVILTTFGVIMVFSAGYYSTMVQAQNDPFYLLKRQALFVLLGFFLMYFFAKIDYHRYIKWAPAIAVLSIGLLLILMTPLGVEVNFATRWIVVFGISITPSELSKLAMIIVTSVYLAKKPERSREFVRGILPLFILAAIHAGLIIWQPNLSTAIVICAITIGIMFVAGLSWGYILGALGALAGGAVIILLFFKDMHWYTRLTSFIDPFAEAQGDGYQVAQSIIALGNGGLTGLGLGNSVSKTLYLPEPQNDFILAIIGEELGFLGIFVLMCAYAYLIRRIFLVAIGAKDKLGLFLASGIGIMLALQVIINIGVVTSSMPATGISLPFISYGGTSILVFMAAMGILLNISKKEGAV